MEHRDSLGQLHHDLHVVLDDQHRQPVAVADLAQALDDLPRLLDAHPGRRLVQQEHPRLERQGDGDLQQALVAVADAARRLVGVRRDAGQLQALAAPLGDAGQSRPRRQRGRAAQQPLRAQPHVLEDRQRWADGGHLHGARESGAGPARRRPCGDVLAAKPDLPRARRREAGEQVDQRRLAGPVRADERAQLAIVQHQPHILDGLQPAEAAAKPARLEDDVAHAAGRPADHDRHTPDSPRGQKITMRISKMPTGICV